MPFLKSVCLTFAIILVLTGCSASPDSSPLSPDLSQQSVAFNSSAHRLWGIYDIYLDNPDSPLVIPLRTTEGHLNARRFLEETPCSSCLVVSNAHNLGGKEWMVDVQIRHPFTGIDKFTGFDVRGIVMFDPSYTFPASGLVFSDPNIETGGALLNADGYTDIFNPVNYPPGSTSWPAWEYQQGKYATSEAPSSVLNPYKEYATENERRYFGCTTADTRTYHIRFPSDGPLHFGYAIDGNWAPPDADPPVVPDDFPISANRPEPFFAAMEITKNTLWSDPDIGGGGELQFILRVYDHQDPKMVSDGGTIDSFKWEIPGMTGWDGITPDAWVEGADSIGNFVAYYFKQSPVPDNTGGHRTLIAINDIESGILGDRVKTFLVTKITVAQGITCWSPGELISGSFHPHPSLQSHLNNATTSFVADDGTFNLYYTCYTWQPRFIWFADLGSISNDTFDDEALAYNISSVPDDEGNVHIVYTDNPDVQGGNVIYRFKDKDAPGTIGPEVILSASAKFNQFMPVVAPAHDGTILVVWMDTSTQPNRRMCAAYYNGDTWSPEMTLETCYLPTSWTNHHVVVDSENNYHIIYQDQEPPDLYHMVFSNGGIVSNEPFVNGNWRSISATGSIDQNDRIYVTFSDDRDGVYRGFFTMRDPDTGLWTDPIDMVGFNHFNTRYQNEILPDGRLAVVWTDWRDNTLGLYSKVFDPFSNQDTIQDIPDDEIDAMFDANKNQTRLCVDENGTLHLVWTDSRDEDHVMLYYSTCTP